MRINATGSESLTNQEDEARTDEQTHRLRGTPSMKSITSTRLEKRPGMGLGMTTGATSACPSGVCATAAAICGLVGVIGLGAIEVWIIASLFTFNPSMAYLLHGLCLSQEVQLVRQRVL
jgi:hypothetical protein